ncbi:HIRAN domain-containing protein [uncultured Methanobrevibacter sp.]|uniref:HIRAN domain-containing protein n=1 Tax=uncultured Methanobrevibacter sp. TaxID=253161 RepID=UPI0025FCD74D|nr:HIRAN domain-containing protein [uncultured Methanobrevibacter sp.]
MTVQKDRETLDGWTKPQKTQKLTRADIFSQEALKLHQKRRDKEALTLISLAIEKDNSKPDYYNTKGLILQKLYKYRQSLEAFDKSLEMEFSEDVLLNKINMLYAWANSLNDKNKALEIITEAIESTAYISQDLDMEKFWYLKGSILDCLGDKLESKKCYMIAENLQDEIAVLDEHTQYIKTTEDTLICITGTQFYQSFDLIREGLEVDLIPEDDNEHDSDAIRVEANGMTIGYVANSPHTMIEGVKSASEIRKSAPKKAVVMFLYLYEYIIAKIV